ncbi:MAG TPA: hypothetical protein VFB21_21305 [Chthonomonadaceae bacterium]|jgi:hypothetical protein|nr:hypothetical protein [Chthonomonadaceae bacterium]
MDWNRFLYVAACVVVPVAWGLVVLWVSNRIETLVLRQGRRKGLKDEEAAMPPLDYHI